MYAVLSNSPEKLDTLKVRLLEPWKLKIDVERGWVLGVLSSMRSILFPRRRVSLLPTVKMGSFPLDSFDSRFPNPKVIPVTLLDNEKSLSPGSFICPPDFLPIPSLIKSATLPLLSASSLQRQSGYATLPRMRLPKIVNPVKVALFQAVRRVT